MSLRWHGARIAAVLLSATLAAAGVPALAAPPSGVFAASFVQSRTQPGFTQPLVSHGELRVDPHQGFTWTITKPYHYVFAMQGERAHEVLPDGTRRELTTANAPWLAAVEHIFVAALSGNQTELEQYFHVQVTAAAGGHGRHVVLTPRVGAMANVIARIAVTENAAGRPSSLDVRDRSGATMNVQFTPAPAASH